MDYEKAAKRLKLKSKNPRWSDETGMPEYYTIEYSSDIGVIKVYYNRGWKYHVSIDEHDEENFWHKHFGKKHKLIDFLISAGAEYADKYWSD